MAVLDVATALTNIRTFYASMTSWQAICGVSSASEAAERIYIGGVDEDTETLVPSIVLEVLSIPLDLKGNHFRGMLEVQVWCEIDVPVASCRTFEDQYLYVWGRWSAMTAELVTASLGSAGLMSQNMRPQQLPGRKDSKINQGRKEWGFTFVASTHLI